MHSRRLLAFAFPGILLILPVSAAAQDRLTCTPPSHFDAAQETHFTGSSSSRSLAVSIHARGASPATYTLSLRDRLHPSHSLTRIVPAADLATAEAALCGVDWVTRYSSPEPPPENLKPRTFAPGEGPLVWFFSWIYTGLSTGNWSTDCKATGHAVPHQAGASCPAPSYDSYGQPVQTSGGIPYAFGTPLGPVPTPPAIAAPTSSAPVSAASTGEAAGQYALGDFNGDGIVDMAYYNSEVFIYLYNAAGKVRSSNFYNVAPNNGAVATGDFNNDGKLDLAIVSYSSSTVPGTFSILLGHGDGNFSAPQTFPTGVNPISLALADLNGDGKLDAIVGNESSSSTPGGISVLTGKGDGTFAAPVFYAAGDTPLSLVAADFTGDGKPDLAMLDTNRITGDTLFVFPGNGDGTLRTPLSSPSGTSIGSLSFTDLNHDGKIDLVLSSFDEGAVAVRTGNGDGTFQPAREYVMSAEPNDVALIPLSGGDTAILTGDGVSGYAWLFYASPNGTVSAPPLQTIGQRSSAIASADLNHDGKPDLVIADAAANAQLVLLNTGNGQFASPVSYPVNGPAANAIADFNGDGKPDLISQNPNEIDVLLGKGDGTFNAAQTTSFNSVQTAMAIADFNSDGKPDLALFNLNGDVAILNGNGNGTFSPGATLSISAGAIASAIVAGDFNGDHIPDLAVLYSPAGSSQTLTINVLLGDGHGGFHSSQAIPVTGYFANGLATADLNRDGKLDLAVTYSGPASSALAIILGKGDGTFQTPSSINTLSGGPGILVTDLNNDGIPDLVLADSSEPSILRGHGDGTFWSELQFPAGPAGSYIAVGDWNGDGKPDLAISSNRRNRATLVVLTNTYSAATVSPVSAVSVGPAFGGNITQSFTFTFSDTAGYQNLKVVDVLINNALDGRQACYLAFVPSSATGGSLFLIDDAGDAGGPYQGLVLPGSGSVSNSQCSVSGAASSVSASGDNFLLTLSISFSPSFAGNKVFYLSAQDQSSNNSGWQALGTWTVPGATVGGPAVSGMNPPRTTTAGPTAYTFTFTDTEGWQDIAVANILVNTAIDGRSACYLAFAPSSAGSGSLFLVDDAGDAAGPYSGMLLPGTGTIGNSQCTVSGAGASVSGDGNTLTLTLPITFSSTFTGNRIFFLAARSNTANSDWQAAGSLGLP